LYMLKVLFLSQKVKKLQLVVLLYENIVKQCKDRQLIVTSVDQDLHHVGEVAPSHPFVNEDHVPDLIQDQEEGDQGLVHRAGGLDHQDVGDLEVDQARLKEAKRMMRKRHLLHLVEEVALVQGLDHPDDDDLEADLETEDVAEDQHPGRYHDHLAEDPEENLVLVRLLVENHEDLPQNRPTDHRPKRREEKRKEIEAKNEKKVKTWIKTILINNSIVS